MEKKTVIKQLLKYALINSDFQKAMTLDETVKTQLSIDMTEIRNECLPEAPESGEVA
jgi:recombination protein RecT